MPLWNYQRKKLKENICGSAAWFQWPSFWTSSHVSQTTLNKKFSLTCIFTLSAFRASWMSIISRFRCSARCLWRRASSSDASHRVKAISFSRRTNLKTHKKKQSENVKTLRFFFFLILFCSITSIFPKFAQSSFLPRWRTRRAAAAAPDDFWRPCHPFAGAEENSASPLLNTGGSY